MIARFFRLDADKIARSRSVHRVGTYECRRRCWIAVFLAISTTTTLHAQLKSTQSNAIESVGDGISISLVEADMRAAILTLASLVDKPVLIGTGVTGRVTVQTPQPIPRRDVLRLLRAMVEGNGLQFVVDSAAGVYRVNQKEPERSVPPATGPQRPGQAGADLTQLFVIHLRHTRAVEVAGTINALYGRASAFGEIGARARGAGPTSTQQFNADPKAPQNPQLTSAAGAVGPTIAPRPAQFSGEVTIVPDANSNTLLIRSGQSDFDLVQAAVRELDVRPLQALIEVIIAEVRRDRSFSFGVEAQATATNDSKTLRSASQKGMGLGDFALHVMRGTAGLDLDATLRASQARGDAHIVSRPIVLATNGETAEILVGSQRPFVQVQRSLPTDTPQRDQVVQYKDVGTRLSVRPTISIDGYISLAVTQEVNAATSETQFSAPIISTRTVQTMLLVRDSQTVVLGGLSDVQRETSQGGIPILSSIPFIGGLFGHASRVKTETEFFLFIRPRVLRSDSEAEELTRAYEERARRAGEPVRREPPPKE